MKKVRHKKAPKSPSDPFASYDETLDRCLTIMALAELVECSDANLSPETFNHAGFLIHEEALKLREKLEMLRRNCQMRNKLIEFA